MKTTTIRTTMTFDSDVMRKLRDKAHREGLSIKKLANETLRAGLHKPVVRKKKVTFPSYSMGQPTIDLTKANTIAAEMEDEEIIRKLQLGK